MSRWIDHSQDSLQAKDPCETLETTIFLFVLTEPGKPGHNYPSGSCAYT